MDRQIYFDHVHMKSKGKLLHRAVSNP